MYYLKPMTNESGWSIPFFKHDALTLMLTTPLDAVVVVPGKAFKTASGNYLS